MFSKRSLHRIAAAHATKTARYPDVSHVVSNSSSLGVAMRLSMPCNSCKSRRGSHDRTWHVLQRVYTGYLCAVHYEYLTQEAGIYIYVIYRRQETNQPIRWDDPHNTYIQCTTSISYTTLHTTYYPALHRISLLQRGSVLST